MWFLYLYLITGSLLGLHSVINFFFGPSLGEELDDYVGSKNMFTHFLTVTFLWPVYYTSNIWGKWLMSKPSANVMILKEKWYPSGPVLYISWEGMEVDMIVPVRRSEGLNGKGWWNEDSNSYREDAVWYYSDFYSIPESVLKFCEKYYASKHKEMEAKHLLKVNEDLRKSNEAFKEMLEKK